MNRGGVWLSTSVPSVLFLAYLLFFHYTEPTEVGIVRNWVSGGVRLDTPGWNITGLWVTVAKVDTRPMRVCVTSAGRGFNCRLVEFRPEGYQEFVAAEGFYYYWWANRISLNFGYDEEYRGVRDLLRGHAYGVRQYSFVKILREYQEGQ